MFSYVTDHHFDIERGSASYTYKTCSTTRHTDSQQATQYSLANLLLFING